MLKFLAIVITIVLALGLLAVLLIVIWVPGQIVWVLIRQKLFGEPRLICTCSEVANDQFLIIKSSLRKFGTES